MSFAALKKQSRSGSLTERLMKKVEKLNEKGNNTDERLWKPAVDKAGNGYAVIRFLPLHMLIVNCHGLKFGVTLSKEQAVGILRIV